MINLLLSQLSKQGHFSRGFFPQPCIWVHRFNEMETVVCCGCIFECYLKMTFEMSLAQLLFAFATAIVLLWSCTTAQVYLSTTNPLALFFVGGDKITTGEHLRRRRCFQPRSSLLKNPL